MTSGRAGLWLRLSALVCLTCGLAAAARAADHAAPRLDQAETAGIYSGGVPDFDAQTFTAGITGTLESVQLRIGWPDDPGPLAVQLRSVVHGVPTDDVLSSSTLYPTKPTASSPLWLTVPLTAPSRAGARYAIVVDNLATSECDLCWNWPSTVRKPQLDAYPGGADYWYVPGNPRWQPLSADGHVIDHPFKTFVAPSPTQEITIPYQPLSAGLAAYGALNPTASDAQPTSVGTPRAGLLVLNSRRDWLRVRQRLASAVGWSLLDGFPFNAHSAAIAYVQVPYSPPPASTYNTYPPAPSDISSLIWIKHISVTAKGYLNVALGTAAGACLPNAQSCATPDSFAQAWVAVVLPARHIRPLRRVHFTITTS